MWAWKNDGPERKCVPGEKIGPRKRCGLRVKIGPRMMPKKEMRLERRWALGDDLVFRGG
jgi:hypothetical protein